MANQMPELIHQLRVSSAKVIFTDKDRVDKVLGAADAEGICHSSIFVIDDDHSSTSQNDCRSITELLQDEELHWQKSRELDSMWNRFDFTANGYRSIQC
jgi:hypothetical protein